MNAKECVAMILAGGHGFRLGSLTRYYAESMLHFGGNHRIIDFTMSNCNNSMIETVGILSQRFTADLRAYIDEIYEPMPRHSDIYMLPPKNCKDPYKGTADAVYKNIGFIDRFEPENVMILSGDHVYNMDYNKLLDFHRETGADVTVASTPVPINDAPRFGIINSDENGRVYSFKEKPRRPRSCMASMGVYVFKRDALKRYLRIDSASVQTRHDFGWDILPKMLSMGEAVYTYRFDGYWRDVGTVSSLWEANMDLLDDPSLRLRDSEWGVQGSYVSNIPDYILREADVRQSIIAGGCSIFGTVEHSVLSDSISVSPNAEIVNSVIMPGAYIGSNAKVYNAVVGTGAIIMDNAAVGADDGSDFFADPEMCSRGVSLVSPWSCIGEGMRLQGGSHIYEERLSEWACVKNINADPNCAQSKDSPSVYHVQHDPLYRRLVI